jgi:SNF2 family DNA or RNA helicase
MGRQPLTLKQYQERGVDRICNANSGRQGALLDPGWGKTPMTLEAFRRLREGLDVSRMLVVAPLNPCYLVWPQELAKWDRFEGLTMEILHGPDKQAKLASKADIFVINPDGLRWLWEQNWDLPEMVVVDELTQFKHQGSERSKRLRRLLATAKFPALRRVGLTGTPAPNGLGDLYGQALVLDDGEACGDTLEEFRKRFWFAPIPDGNGRAEYKPTPRSMELLSTALKKLMFRPRASDHLELPQVVATEVPVEIPSEAKAMYKQLRKELIVELGHGEVMLAVNSGALVSKCRQIANGVAYVLPDGRIAPIDEFGHSPEKLVREIHEAKCERLLERWEEFGRKPLLVGYEFRHELDMIVRYLRERGVHPVVFPRSSERTEIDRITSAWNAGQVGILLGNPAAVSLGLNLQAGGNRLLWFGPIFDWEKADQLIKRLARQGQVEKQVFVDTLIARGTLDPYINRRQTEKATEQNTLLDALKEDP